MWLFHQVEVLGDRLRHLILNPPLAPGSQDAVAGDAVDVAGAADGGGAVGGNSSSDPLILRYLPLLVLLSLFWPVLLTLIAASVSASAWLFWLGVGAAFGLIQLLYVLYNFAMIVCDLSMLTVLKTFAMLRSFVRYYTFKMTDAAGIDISGRRRRGIKKRRRKDWREEVDRATSYTQFCGIEIYEPEQHDDRGGGGGAKKVVVQKSRLVKRTVSVDTSERSSPGKSSRFGMRLRRKSSARGLPQSASSPPGSPMRKIRSSLDLSKNPVGVSQRRSTSAFRATTTAGGGGGDDSSPLRRVSSSIAFSESNDEDDAGRKESCPKWQRVVEEDLGMPGSMLLTTLSRLKEARVQASSMRGGVQASGGDGAESGDGGPDEHDNEREGGGKAGYDDDFSTNSLAEEADNERGESFHITSFTTRSVGGRQRRVDEDYSSSLKTLLSGIVKRNHLSVDDFLMQDARSVAERGQHSLRKETREAIDRYGEEVERCIDWVASGAVYLGNGSGGGGAAGEDPGAGDGGDKARSGNTPEQVMQKQRDELAKRYTLFKRMKQNMGHTALMLSGGGAQAMYHLGTIKALVESNLYQHIHVISGTSGGSISAAMCAIKSPEELLKDICVSTVSTDYMLNGEMKRLGVSWFPSIYKMGSFWLKKRLLMDGKEFLRCCQFYYSDITFEEAFEMTGKHVCITVSASRASAGSGVQRLLLNHISTPNVTLASAVAASCAVPGIMAPCKLMIKDSRGKQVPFEVDGVEWIDGSVQADLPFKRISTLFNISNFVVAQTNFHVVPFLNKAHHPNITTLYWKIFQMCMWDVKSRVLNLSQLGLFPKFFGQDLSKMFNQKYYGKLTLVPRFTTMQLFGLKVLSNPTVADMENYLQNGQLASWPFLRVLREMLRIERAIDAGLSKLDQRLKSIESRSDVPLPNDDVDSLSSTVGAAYRAHLPGLGREAELLKERVRDLEQENKQLRQQVMRLQRSMGISLRSNTALEGRLIAVTPVEEDDDEKKEN